MPTQLECQYIQKITSIRSIYFATVLLGSSAILIMRSVEPWPSWLKVWAPRIATRGEYWRSIILDPVDETTSWANVDVLNLSSMIG